MPFDKRQISQCATFPLQRKWDFTVKTAMYHPIRSSGNFPRAARHQFLQISKLMTHKIGLGGKVREHPAVLLVIGAFCFIAFVSTTP
jgi:hypothetical protein